MAASTNDSPDRSVLLYDSECGFCQRWCDRMKRRGAEAVIEFADCRSSIELRQQAGVAERECDQTAIMIERRGESIRSVRRGAAAINAVLLRLPGRRNLWLRVLGRAYCIPGLKQLEEIGYRLVARNRGRFGKRACARP